MCKKFETRHSHALDPCTRSSATKALSQQMGSEQQSANERLTYVEWSLRLLRPRPHTHCSHCRSTHRHERGLLEVWRYVLAAKRKLFGRSESHTAILASPTSPISESACIRTNATDVLFALWIRQHFWTHNAHYLIYSTAASLPLSPTAATCHDKVASNHPRWVTSLASF